MKHINILFALLFSIVVASCNQGSETPLFPPSENVSTWTIPTVGTQFVFADSENQSVEPAIDTFIIAKTGQHESGKTNVISYLEVTENGGSDSGYYNIETNGDFSFGERDGDSAGMPFFTWDTYPTGSEQTINFETPVDTTLANGNQLIESDARSFVGIENLTLPAGSFSTIHIRQVFIDSEFFTTSNSSSSEREIEDYWFAPSLGMYVKFAFTESEDGQIDDETDMELIKYIPAK